MEIQLIHILFYALSIIPLHIETHLLKTRLTISGLEFHVIRV